MSPSSVYILTAIGKRQSPIDIVTDSVQVTRRLLTRSIVEDNGDVVDHGKTDLQIDYTPITNSGGNLSLENTGHGWKLNIPNSIGEQCPISSGPLGSDKFRLLQVHAHWGKDNTSGSEHTVNGKSFPCEVHLVHWNASRYSSPSEAQEASDGLAVVGVFIDVCGAQPNKVFDAIDAVVDKIVPRDSAHVQLPASSINLNDLLPSDQKYFSYLGSLTTPPFSESVIWIVMQTPVQATEEQIAKFRQLQENEQTDHRVTENWRPTQPLHGRDVYYFK